MIYYLSGFPEQKEMIDTFLHENEVAPICHQKFDPVIFQGDRKILSRDSL